MALVSAGYLLPPVSWLSPPPISHLSERWDESLGTEQDGCFTATEAGWEKFQFLSALFMPGLGAKAIVGNKASLLPKLSFWEGGQPYCLCMEAEHRAQSVVLESP